MDFAVGDPTLMSIIKGTDLLLLHGCSDGVSPAGEEQYVVKWSIGLVERRVSPRMTRGALGCPKVGSVGRGTSS